MVDDPGQTGHPGDLVVQVDRHRVARGRRVPERLVLVDVLENPGRRGPLAQRLVEPVAGRRFPETGTRVDLPEERGHPLLVHQFAGVRAGLDINDHGRPVLPALEPDRLGADREGVAGVDRAVEMEVLLAVHQLHQQLHRRHRQRRGRHREEGGHHSEHRRGDLAAQVPLDRVIGGRRVLGDPLGGHLEPLLVGPDAEARGVEFDCVVSVDGLRHRVQPTSSANFAREASRSAAAFLATALPIGPTIMAPLKLASMTAFEPEPAGSTLRVNSTVTPAMPVPAILTRFGASTSVTVHSILLAIPITETTSVKRAPRATSVGSSLFQPWWMVSHSSQRDRSERVDQVFSGAAGRSAETETEAMAKLLAGEWVCP
ncbi:hypothetical protein BTZ20_0412 [Rhodococcus sp. MTM3W5.2]|nr:hypothetical protein BTZ20_0412 [Rhodococcus sp. MTM3W5.2]